jgi:3-isopropylmalate dehydrogenase
MTNYIMVKKTITLLPGDGVGPEVIKQGIKILQKIAEKYHHEFVFQYGLIGASAIKQTNNPLPDKTLTLCKNSDAILFGAIGDPKYDLDPKTQIRPEQGLLKLRQLLNLYANLRPVKVYPELIDISPIKKERVEGADLIVVRELTGGIYFGQPQLRKDNGNTAIDTCVYTRDEITRIAKIAFELATKRKKTLTSVDKANVLETSRLWRETVNEVANNYSDVQLSHLFVDNAAMQLIKNPKSFDVVLTENMFGDILTDEASVISGSIGMLPSASIGNKHALYEPIHGAFNKAAGKNIANPIATILSCAMMMRISFNLEEEAKTVENAVIKAITKGYRTNDISDSKNLPSNILGTEEMGNIIQKYI